MWKSVESFICRSSTPSSLSLLFYYLHKLRNQIKIKDTLIKHWIHKSDHILRQDNFFRKNGSRRDATADCIDEIYANPINQSKKRSVSYHTAINDFVTGLPNIYCVTKV